MVEQVGGDHYEATYQHWDWVVDTRLGYLEGNATKYVSRWRKKGGAQDLRKAQSYVKKIIQCRYAGKPLVPAGSRYGRDPAATEAFIKSANLRQEDADLIRKLDGWTLVSQLLDLSDQLSEMAEHGGSS